MNTQYLEWDLEMLVLKPFINGLAKISNSISVNIFTEQQTNIITLDRF